jgi:hypothetical protein
MTPGSSLSEQRAPEYETTLYFSNTVARRPFLHQEPSSASNALTRSSTQPITGTAIRVAEDAITRCVGRRPPLPQDPRVIIGEALQPFALARRQAPHAAAGERQSLRFKIDPGVCRAGCRDLDGARLPAAAKRQQPAIAGKIGVPHRIRRQGRRQQVYVIFPPATVSSAARKCGGSVLPRFTARRRIPAEAFALKKYRRGSSPVSMMSDNEHAAPALGHSEILSVKNSVGEPIPALPQRPEEGAKVAASVR